MALIVLVWALCAWTAGGFVAGGVPPRRGPQRRHVVSHTSKKNWCRGATTTSVEGPDGLAPRQQEDTLNLAFDHVEVFVSHLQPLAEYRRLEAMMNGGQKIAADEVDAWRGDLVAQLICGVDWRVTGVRGGDPEKTSGISLAVSAPGPAKGADRPATFVITAGTARAADFVKKRREGVGVLGFRCASVRAVRDRYARTHPALLVGALTEDEFEPPQVEAWAYYASHPAGVTPKEPKEEVHATLTTEPVTTLQQRQPETSATRFRFVESTPTWVTNVITDAKFPPKARAQRASADHWVSNVIDRHTFCRVCDEALGLGPRVEFNAGVIAAGRAAIESTVVGGDSVFLPVNNAVSDFGHVAQYLNQIGQGVQHVATRVDDLVALVETVDRRRAESGGVGLSFLDVPRSYYGPRLDAEWLAIDAGVDLEVARRAIDALRLFEDDDDDHQHSGNLLDADGLLSVDDPSVDVRVHAALRNINLDVDSDEHTIARLERSVLRSRYANVRGLLGDALTDDQYLAVARHRILVDKQGPDALLQIFTAPVLRRDPTHEAPFLEFIQRVCSVSRGDDDDDDTAVLEEDNTDRIFGQSDLDDDDDDTSFGCGGFGIRNFLTLFLSIELNAAIADLRAAETTTNNTPEVNADDDDGVERRRRRHEKRRDLAEAKLACLAAQLDDSNDLLNAIADAATEEADLLRGKRSADRDATTALQAAQDRKAAAQADLQALSDAYAKRMAAIEEEGRAYQ